MMVAYKEGPSKLSNKQYQKAQFLCEEEKSYDRLDQKIFQVGNHKKNKRENIGIYSRVAYKLQPKRFNIRRFQTL